MRITRTPLFFGPERRSLFGWLHAPDGARRDIAIVICPPFGHEYINSHRPLRHLADGLAEAGVPALRFDYDGTGDSAGRDEDPNRVAAWTDSVIEAVRALRELSGCRRIGLVGVRLGAALAIAAATKIEVACLVAWAPFIRGRSYVREMKALHLTGSNSNAGTESGQIEPGGFLFTDETQRDIARIDLAETCPKTTRALIVARDDLNGDASLRDTWLAAGIVAEQRALPGFTEMMLPPQSVIVPNVAIAEITDWIVAETGNERPVQPPASNIRRERSILDGQPAVEIRESIVHDDRLLFGILTEPVTPDHRKLPTILLSNAGAAHHVGPVRLYVLMARRLAACGFRSLRFDLPGLGDSIVADLAQENICYVPAASAVVRAAIAAMQQRNADAFVLTGLCSGAHTSFHAALDLDGAPIVEAMLINPLTFYYSGGMPLELVPSTADAGSGHAKSFQWLRSWVRHMRVHFRIVTYRFRGIHPTTAVALRTSGHNTKRGDLEGDLRRIVDSGRRVTFVFARFDPGYDLLMINAAPLVRRLRKEGQIRLWFIENANHTFEARQSREVMFDSVARHLVGRYADSRQATP
jgi:alpha-beta hydrolase superfamily lysophospholipase